MQNFWKIFCMFQVYGSLWASESFSGLKQRYGIVSWDNEMVLKILIYWIVARLTFAIVFKFLCIFSFSEFNDEYWPTKLFTSRRWVIWQNLRDKKLVLSFFCCEIETSFKFCLSVFFLYDLFTNNGRNLEIAESNPIMKNICSSLSVPSFFFSFTFYFSVTLSLSVSLCLSLSLSLCLCRTSAAVMWCNIIIYYPH